MRVTKAQVRDGEIPESNNDRQTKNEVVGHTKLSTKLQLVLYNPPYLNRAGKVEGNFFW